jgi:alpha-N-acetylglucosamine transferase
MRPSFRVCWHKLRLFLLTQYQAIVALDSDIVVLHNVDQLVTKVRNRTLRFIFNYCFKSLLSDAHLGLAM